ncbi:unnamed protein product, partial [Pylaiella littoralis]
MNSCCRGSSLSLLYCMVIFVTCRTPLKSTRILPLYHKSVPLCFYAPSTVSDVFGDNFFEIFGVFWVETHGIYFFLAHYPAHGLAANKKVVRPKMAVFDPFQR